MRAWPDTKVADQLRLAVDLDENGPEARRFRRSAERIQTFERALALAPATSPAEATIQIALAADRLGEMAAGGDSGTSGNDARLCYLWLRAALMGLARHHSGLSLFLCDIYIPDRSSPSAAAVAAEKGGAA